MISQKVRDAERARQYEEYKDRVGEIVVGTVKRAESYSITVDLGRAEAVIRREEMIPRENLRQGDRVRAYIIDVREEQRGPQIFLSRACNEFMAKLFTQEAEIYDGIIEIKGVPVKQEAVQRSPSCPMIRGLIRLVPALAAR